MSGRASDHEHGRCTSRHSTRHDQVRQPDRVSSPSPGVSRRYPALLCTRTRCDLDLLPTGLHQEQVHPPIRDSRELAVPANPMGHCRSGLIAATWYTAILRIQRTASVNKAHQHHVHVCCLPVHSGSVDLAVLREQLGDWTRAEPLTGSGLLLPYRKSQATLRTRRRTSEQASKRAAMHRREPRGGSSRWFFGLPSEPEAEAEATALRSKHPGRRKPDALPRRLIFELHPRDHRQRSCVTAE